MTEPQQARRSHRDVLMQVFEAMNTGNAELWGEVLADDVVTEYPQSGERFVGRENNMAILRNYPGGHMSVDLPNASVYVDDEGHYVMTPTFNVVKVDGEGDTIVGSGKSTYPDGSEWYVVNIATFRGDKIAHAVLYFAPVFEAPEWRKPLAEQV
jgi:ketosteroid isomerase-like protein